MRIIGIGDNVCDKYRTISTMFPGGQALNVAVYCRLQGCFSAYMGVFGTDRVGNHIKETLTAEGWNSAAAGLMRGKMAMQLLI